MWTSPFPKRPPLFAVPAIPGAAFVADVAVRSVRPGETACLAAWHQAWHLPPPRLQPSAYPRLYRRRFTLQLSQVGASRRLPCNVCGCCLMIHRPRRSHQILLRPRASFYLFRETRLTLDLADCLLQQIDVWLDLVIRCRIANRKGPCIS